MFIAYRIIGIFLNVVAVMLAISLLMSFAVIFTSPLNMLSAFLIISIILYTWFSNKFSKQVLQLKQPVKHSLRDWVRVNGIVALVYSTLAGTAAVYLIYYPNLITELLKNLPSNVPVQEADVRNLFIFMLVYAIFMIIHILLTFYYLKMNKEFFVEPKE